MQIEGASKIIESIDQTIGKDGLDNKKLIPKLKELRELAREEEDPLVVKTLRLIYEYLEENNAFDIVPAVIVDEEDEEEEPEEPMDLTDTENLQYLMQLIAKSENPYNREEIKGYRTELWDI
jgi:hypothetical protein